MRSEQTHSDELDIDAAAVARLIAAQFSQWANLPVVKLPSAGTDHAMYRLADDMVVRLPRISGVARQVDTEQRWLPHLAPHLPLRRRGYGAALTARAVLDVIAAGARRALLMSSEMGLTTYERLGFQTLEVWSYCERPSPDPDVV
jgi:hypothetical protein